MKRAAAIILSLTVIWLQMMASAQTLAPTGPVEPACDCCVEQEVCRCCCVAPTAPETKPLPVAPVAASVIFDFTALVPKQVVWLLPAGAPAIVSSPDGSASSLAVPLFTRHCALLI
jgi:hypothetical protein